jgi:hypothetical protein
MCANSAGSNEEACRVLLPFSRQAVGEWRFHRRKFEQEERPAVEENIPLSNGLVRGSDD